MKKLFLDFLRGKKKISHYLRGFVYHLFAFPHAGHLRVGYGSFFNGEIEIDYNVSIGSNCTLEKKVKIGSNTRIGNCVRILNHEHNYCIIGNHCTVNENTLIIGKVSIGDDCLIAGNTSIVGSNHVFESLDKTIRQQGIHSKGIVIENNVWIGTQVVILDNVHVGTGAVLGAGAVVTKDVPSNAVVVGNPAKILRKRGE